MVLTLIYKVLLLGGINLGNKIYNCKSYKLSILINEIGKKRMGRGDSSSQIEADGVKSAKNLVAVKRRKQEK